MTHADQQIAKELVRKLREAATRSVKRIIFYGSRATGRATPESDFDFLVIEDASVMGEEEFEETKKVVGGLAYPANKYGAVLYENA